MRYTTIISAGGWVIIHRWGNFKDSYGNSRVSCKVNSWNWAQYLLLKVCQWFSKITSQNVSIRLNPVKIDINVVSDIIKLVRKTFSCGYVVKKETEAINPPSQAHNISVRTALAMAGPQSWTKYFAWSRLWENQHNTRWYCIQLPRQYWAHRNPRKAKKVMISMSIDLKRMRVLVTIINSIIFTLSGLEDKPYHRQMGTDNLLLINTVSFSVSDAVAMTVGLGQGWSCLQERIGGSCARKRPHHVSGKILRTSYKQANQTAASFRVLIEWFCVLLRSSQLQLNCKEGIIRKPMIDGARKF